MYWCVILILRHILIFNGTCRIARARVIFTENDITTCVVVARKCPNRRDKCSSPNNNGRVHIVLPYPLYCMYISHINMYSTATSRSNGFLIEKGNGTFGSSYLINIANNKQRGQFLYIYCMHLLFSNQLGM